VLGNDAQFDSGVTIRHAARQHPVVLYRRDRFFVLALRGGAAI